jgi:signal transduction histidine kinase/CheY-like chemotaxis protein
VAERLLFADRQVLERREPVEGRFDLELPDGTRRHVIDVKFSVPALGERPPELVGGFAVDVTQTVEQERRLRELDRERQERARLDSIGILAGGVAHDFNNLLFAIRGSVELAREESDPRERQALLDAALERTEYASALCARLLTYAGQGATEPTRLRPEALLAESRELDALARQHGATLERTVAPGLPELVADALQLRQVLLNLVTNAVEASRESESPAVELDCRHRAAPSPLPLSHDWSGPDSAPHGFVCFRVTDRGVGMTIETARRAFEPFFSERAGGHGLGLASVLGIVRQHRGAVGIESEPGLGTRVEVAFPAAAVTADGGPVPGAIRTGVAPARQASGQEASGRRLLVVDDEPAVCRTVARLLERLGARVDAFEDPEVALRHLEGAGAAVPYDAALIDFQMPGMSGPELAARIRARRPGLSILLSSGAPEADLASVAERHEVLPKPYSLARLRAALAALFQAR